MADRNTLDSIRKEFEKNPAKLKDDPAFAVKFTKARNLDEIDISIKALSALIPDVDSCLFNKMKKSWEEFLIKVNL